MPDKQKNQNPESKDNQKEKVGDIIRKERVTRRISLDTIARDLKLNVKYLKALENNDYGSLPADAYVRVYLRSLAKYLMLDPEHILKNYYAERGIDPSQKSEIKKVRISEVEPRRSFVPWIVVVAVLVGLGVGSYFVNNRTTVPSPETEEKPTETDALDSLDMLSDSIMDTLISSFIEEEGADTGQEDTEPAEPMSLILHVVGDSSWVQVFSDGTSWKNTLTRGTRRSFVAVDSFNVNVGENSAVRYTLNGKNLAVEGSDVVIFKIGSKGIPEIWTMEKWRETFGDRE